MTRSVVVGVTGHQHRPGIDWAWVACQIHQALLEIAPVRSALSSLAVGADQVFAIQALELQIPVVAVIPLDDYEAHFRTDAVAEYRQLLRRSSTLCLKHPGPPSAAFLAAGRYIAEASDILLAVWDGEPAVGEGGTGDIVDFARQLATKVVHIDPLNRTRLPLGPRD